MNLNECSCCGLPGDCQTHADVTTGESTYICVDCETLGQIYLQSCAIRAARMEQRAQ